MPHNDTNRIVISPGEFYVSIHQEVISTLLGSCVAACLFDPVKNIIGMNHFLLAYNHYSYDQSVIESDAGRYGLFAMEMLINEMMKKGANKLNLKAKCFGGGNVLFDSDSNENKPTVGDVNVLFIKEFLRKENIPLVSACLGGDVARVVHFIGSDYSVFVKKINRYQEKIIVKQEQTFWKQHVSDPKKTNLPEFW